MKPTHHVDFDPTAINFAKTPAKTNRGSKIIYVNSADGNRIRVQTPVMSAPFGISTYEDSSTGLKSYSVDGSFKGHETNQFLESFLGKCRALDDHLADSASKNSKEWFGKASSIDVVHELMRKLVREPVDPKYAPTVRFKIAADSNSGPATEFFDEHGKHVDMEYLTKGSTFRAIVELSSVWFIQKSFGITLRVLQVGVVSQSSTPAQEKLDDYAFVSGNGDDDMFTVD